MEITKPASVAFMNEYPMPTRTKRVGEREKRWGS